MPILSSTTSESRCRLVHTVFLHSIKHCNHTRYYYYYYNLL